jgi:hypothetical protein
VGLILSPFAILSTLLVQLMKNDTKWNTMSGLDKVNHTARYKCDTEQRRKIDLTEFFKLVSRDCANHLSWVASARDEQWEEAEKNGDLRIAITQFCEAVDATENYTGQMFKRFEDDVERIDNVDASTYLTIKSCTISCGYVCILSID